MKTLNLTGKLILLGILGAALMAIMPINAIAAQTGGGLPGSACGDEADLIYDPPPFMGQIQVFYNENNSISVTTIMPLPRHGQSGCTLTLITHDLGTFDGVENETDFRSLRPGDMHGVCTNCNLGEIMCGGIPYDAAYIELVSVGNMTFSPEEDAPSFTASAVIMALEYK